MILENNELDILKLEPKTIIVSVSANASADFAFDLSKPIYPLNYKT